MATTTESKAQLGLDAGAKISPPLTEQERARVERLVAQGADPIAAAETVLDERVGTIARAIRARDGDPYPPLESLLDESTRKSRAKARVNAEFGEDGVPLSPDLAREAAALQEAKDEIERLRKAGAEKDARLASADTDLSELEAMRQRVAEAEAEVAALRASQGGGTPTKDVQQVTPGPGEQTGGLAGSTERTDDAGRKK